jgi:hypothetical protein
MVGATVAASHPYTIVRPNLSTPSAPAAMPLEREVGLPSNVALAKSKSIPSIVEEEVLSNPTQRNLMEVSNLGL